jgi:hypothetical protein
MKKISLLAPLLAAAACGGGSSKQPTGPGAGDVAQSGEAGGGAATAQPDPHLEARKAFESPGGMWMPRQISTLAPDLAKLGLEIDPAQLADPLSPVLGSVVSLGGCSASFVSPDGLVVTNHHCVQGALGFNSSEKENLVENGFLAKERSDERSAGPNQRVFVAQAFRDITKDVLSGLDAIPDPVKRKGEIAKREKKLIAECEQGRAGVKCKTGSFFRGAEWQLIEYLEIKDVRLVYVPHRGVGNFGGEIDNWAWPRHTGDWSFYRAYVGKDGQPAAFSADNVPYKPKHWLKLGTAGVAKHDLVFVAGYPGKTNRLETVAETRRTMEVFYPRYLTTANAKMAMLAEIIKGGGDAAIKAGVYKQYIQNYLERNTGVLAGLQGGAAVRKEKLEASFKEWAKADPARAKYTDALAQIDARVAQSWTTEPQDVLFKELVGAQEGNAGKHSGSQLLRHAIMLVRNAGERAKADGDRRPGFQDRDKADNEGEIKAFGKRYDASIDRGLLRLAIKNAAALPEADRPWLAVVLGAKKGAKIDDKVIDGALDKLYAGTTLPDEKLRLEVFQKGTTRTVKASKDSFLKLAVALLPYLDQVEAREAAVAGDLALLMPVYIEGLVASQNGKVAPDANATLRLSYGTVRGYKPRPDAEVYEPFTGVKGILAKNTGKAPFDAPERTLAAIKKGVWGPYAAPELGEVPVDTLSDLDITGGNSGSPVLNGKGELIGLAFDGNIEGVASDVVFNGENTRTITVDVRYLLWTMDAVDGADHLVKEMGVTPAI